jgi:hypothetical protein
MSEKPNFKPMTGWEIISGNPHLLETGDVIHVQSHGLLSFLIRVFSRGPFEPKSWASHSAMVLRVDGGIEIIEATRKVGRRPIDIYKGRNSKLIISRKPGGLDDHFREEIIKKSGYYHGLKYGVGKIILHFLDYIFGSIYLFRRLAINNKYPICSWIVAYVYDRVLGYKFGVEPNAAQPDDISDYCVADGWNFVWANSQASMDNFCEAYQMRVERKLKRTK